MYFLKKVFILSYFVFLVVFLLIWLIVNIIVKKSFYDYTCIYFRELLVLKKIFIVM